MVAGFTPNVPLARKTTFKVGGSATYYAEARSVSELITLLENARLAEQPVTILAGGSNVLVADEGVAGCVIVPAITSWDVRELDDWVDVTVGAGEVFDEVIARAVATGWWGLENLSHIPGWVGATPIQNVGAYGVEVSDVIVSVRAVSKDTGAVCEFSNAACQFGYRDSFFKTPAGREWVVTHVTYRLSCTPRPQLQYRDLSEFFGTTTPSLPAVREAVMTIRAKKFPNWHEVGTAGSFFMNPVINTQHFAELQTRYPTMPGYPVTDEHVKVPLGWILDNVCGLRGYYDGKVGCYEGQALVVVHTGGASTSEILDFAKHVATLVFEKTQITISPEVTLLQ